VFNQIQINAFIELGKDVWHETRVALQTIFGVENKAKYEEKILKGGAHQVSTVRLTMPVFVRDYTDFYSSKNHAMNMGIMFRGKENALMPNWVHIPIGYHGRASSVVVSGTEFVRPKG
jgi:fumarylacetoacetase